MIGSRAMRGESALPRVNDGATQSFEVIALLDLPHLRARLADSLKSHAALFFASSEPDLLAMLRSDVRPASVILVPAVDGNTGAATDRLVRRIAVERPRAAIVAWCPGPANYTVDLRALTAAGVHQFWLPDPHDGGVVLRSILLKARQVNAAEYMMKCLSQILPAELHPFVEAALESPGQATTIRALADLVGVHRRTIFNRCRRSSPLSPTQLLVWVRLALVAFHLENTACTVETIAIDLAYPSSAALRNTLKRYTGHRASELRERGPIDSLLGRLRERIRWCP